MKNEGYISGSWRIARSDNNDQKWQIVFKQYAIKKDLKKFLQQANIKNFWAWVKINYISILSVSIFLIFAVVAIVVIITSHVFS